MLPKSWFKNEIKYFISFRNRTASFRGYVYVFSLVISIKKSLL